MTTTKPAPDCLYTLAPHPDGSGCLVVVWADRHTGRVMAVAPEYVAPHSAMQRVIDYAQIQCRDPRTTRKMLRWTDASSSGATVNPRPIDGGYRWTCDHATALACALLVGK
jgi:hypothetical protein